VAHIEQIHSKYQTTISIHDTWHIIIRCRI